MNHLVGSGGGGGASSSSAVVGGDETPFYSLGFLLQNHHHNQNQNQNQNQFIPPPPPPEGFISFSNEQQRVISPSCFGAGFESGDCFYNYVLGYQQPNPLDGSSSKWDFSNKFMAPPPPQNNSGFSNELLSLSLAANPVVVVAQDHCSEMRSCCSGYSLKMGGSDHNNTSCSSNNNNSSSLSLSSGSYKPIQFPSSVLSGSVFLHTMQEILAEIAGFAVENLDINSFSGDENMLRWTNSSSSHGVPDQNNKFLQQQRDGEAKKKHLLALLQMVDDQYNQCLDEIHTVISAFHAVTDLDPNLHARFAIPAISIMYNSLRERISSHILAMGTQETEQEAKTKEDNSDNNNGSALETSFIQKQWAIQQLKKKDHHLWRPQRGLPERSVSVLRAWMFQNFLHPYPKDAEKHLLAIKSGLTRSQVSNWFINARVRLWKPMIEEMCAEMNRRKSRRSDQDSAGDGGVAAAAAHRNQFLFNSNASFTN